MPGIFSRRRGASTSSLSNRSLAPSSSSSSFAATTAASQAFLQGAPSNGALSAAAAAAALRSQTTSPEPVGSIQTKRMVRRGSVSSVGSGSVIGAATRGGMGRGTLQRTNSGGSMTGRTFRSPSPGRQNGNGAVSPSPNAPPVPALPRTYSKGQPRSSSLEPQQRVMSPTPSNGGRAASVDRANVAPPAASRKAKRLSNVNEVEELVRRDSRSSINYSRPMVSPPTSPIASSPPSATARNAHTHGQGSWFSGATGTGPISTKASARPGASSGVGAQRAANLQQDIQSVANQPTGKKNFPQPAQGSYLARVNAASDNAYGETPTASYDSADTVVVYDPNSRTFIARPRTVPKQPVPPSPTLPQAPTVAPGTYDPNTRSIVPIPQSTSHPPTDPAPSAGSVKKPRPALAAVDTTLQPPPRNPARLSPSTDSPVSPRMLDVRSRVVREGSEGESEADPASPVASNFKADGRTIQTSAGPAKSYVAAGAPHNRTASLDIPKQSTEGGGRGRVLSLSPQRSAHFSQALVSEGMRHVPPPRSVSPVKSAMKHSPASSLRTNSPMAMFSSTGVKAPPSEASDSASLASQDGLLAKKKKSVRVSFDEQPQEIAPLVAAVNRERSPAVDDDMDEVMKPRPALPSFGSVRKNRQPEMAEKVTEMPPERHQASSDHAVGGILRDSFADRAQDDSAPLPPEVTSKEPAGYASDASDDVFDPPVTSTPAKAKADSGSVPGSVVDDGEPASSEPGAQTMNRPGLAGEAHAGEDEIVPAINLLPPTPGVDETSKELGDADGVDPSSTPGPKTSLEGFVVPGGWSGDGDSDDKNVAVHPSSPSNDTTLAEAAEPDIVEQPMRSNLTSEAGPAPVLDAIDEDSDDSAAFSDAAEDLSDVDNGGFASLDAIAVSPIVIRSQDPDKVPASPSSPVLKVEKPSAETATSQVQDGEVGGSGDWGQATAYWSQLSRQQRQQIERQHLSSDDEARPPPAITKKPRKKKTAAKPNVVATTSTAVPRQPPAQTTQASQQPPQPALKSALKKSMRAQPGPAPAPATADGDVHMRRSMRSSGPMMSTMRDNPPGPRRPRPESMDSSGSLQKKSAPRPTSSGPLSPSSTGAAMRFVPNAQQSAYPNLPANQPRPPRPSSAVATGTYTAKLQKQVTNDSDSESSFKKKRRGSVSTMDSQGKYNMKRSMRGGPAQESAVAERRPTSPTPAGKGRGSFSIRSLSPTGSLFGRNKPDKLRESLRGSSVDTSSRRTTMRGPPPSGKGSGRSRPATATAAPPRRKFRSRFGDSDDSDEEGPSFFRSRFADSDDDEPGSPGVIPADLTPVRGIPRRPGQNDGDSTDLEDEDDGGDARKASRKRTRQPKPIVPDPADVEKAMAAARRNLGIVAPDATTASTVPGGKAGQALGKGSLRNAGPAEERPEPKSRPEDADPGAEKKKRGFMSSILRRNRGSSLSVHQVGRPSSPPPPLPTSPHAQSSPSSPAQPYRPDLPASPSSPASPSAGKLVRRHSRQPGLTRGDSSYSTFSNATAPAPTSPVGGPVDGNNWPLPPPIPTATARGPDPDGRPYTSDGVGPASAALGRPARPDPMPRSQSGQQLGQAAAGRHRVRIAGLPDGVDEDPDEGEGGNAGPRAVYSARTGKKKKFGLLRRAFGLND